MKKITLLILVSICWSAPLFSQANNLNEWIDSQYLSPSHKAFIYQVSPASKAADLFLINAERKAEKQFSESMKKFKGKVAVNSDTTWTFSESKAIGDSLYRPYEYSYRWSEGEDFANSVTNYNFYRWYADSTKWFPTRKTFSKNLETATEDSSTTYYYQGPTDEPYYGTRGRNVKAPTQGADYEYYRDQYSPVDGWVKNQRELRYRDENGSDTLTVDESYNKDDMVYRKTSERRYIYNDNYTLSSYKYFNNDAENEVYSWSYDYTKLGQDGRYEYQVSKRLDYDTKELVGEDSLQFIYNNDYVEGRGYTWQDTVWTIETFYRSYQRTFANPDPNDTYHPMITQVDSVIVYSVYPDSLDDNGNIVIDEAITRTEFDYNANGNQIEIRNYSLSDGLLALANRTVRTWELIAGRYVQTHQESYGRDFFSGEMYKSGFSNNFYNDEGVNEGSESFNLNASGDTTYGTGYRSLTLDDGTRINLTLRYDVSIKKMVVQYYRAYKTEQYDVVGKYTNQSSYVDPINYSGSRSISAGGALATEIVFNDGPVNISMGDTLTLFVSARNIDLTVPDVSVTNMPSTATFDPETKKFYWIVDDEAPSPMTYTATSSRGSTSIQVPFVNAEDVDGNTSVSNEEELFGRNQFILSQNYPNPFNPSTTISFVLPQASEVSLQVYNMIGQQVATLVNGRMGAGAQAVQFDASNLSSGMYIYRLKAGEFTKTKKMMLIK
ncbi:MAG: T9SS type A sorting domain-containing protein [Balneola sp.]